MKGKKTGGRKAGTLNKRTQAMQAAMKAAALGLPTGASALERLQAIYRDDSQPLDVRMQALALALPYESPKLAAIQHTGAGGAPLVFPVVNVALAHSGSD
jgi:hypothetical protein